jgi:hypothetical protein
MSEQEPRPKPPRIGRAGPDPDDRFTAFVDKWVIGYFAPFFMGAAVATITVIFVTFCASLVANIWQERDLAAMGLIAVSIGGGLAGLMLKWKWSIK